MPSKRTGCLTGCGVQVLKDQSTMFVEIDGVRVNCPSNKKITIDVE